MKHTRQSKYSAIKPIALQHIANGASASAVGRELGIPQPTVSRWARQAGLKIQHQSHCPKVSMMDKHRVIYEMLIAGTYSVAQIAAQAGVCTSTVYNQRASLTTMNTRSRITPGDVSRVGTGRRLGLAERLVIADCLRAGHSHRRIAQIVCRSQSTVSREIARNSVDGIYDAYQADQASRGRLARPKPRKLDDNRFLRAQVVGLLNRGASPRQASDRLAALWGDNTSMTISHESIYQALYVQGVGSLRKELVFEKSCRTTRPGRKPRSLLAGVPKPRGKRWTHDANISLRPAEANDRAVPGHWEGDLIIGADGTSALATLVERRSRFVLLGRLGTDHTAASVNEVMVRMIRRLKESMDTTMSTLTWDQGVEFAKHTEFSVAENIQVFFADPHSPWQRGSNERMNRDIRFYFPKGTNFTDVTDQEVDEAEALLNNRPRVVLDGLTPREVISGVIHDAMTA